MTGPRDHLLSVNQIRLVRGPEGPPTSLGSFPSGELCALAAESRLDSEGSMKAPCKEEVQKKEDGEGEAAAPGPQAETLEAKRSWTADSHSASGTEGASSSAWGPVGLLT